MGSLLDQLVVLVFEIEGHRYAIDTDSVLEIVRAVQPARLPRAPRVISGVINVRGELLPLLDLRVRFGLPERALRIHDVLVIVQAGARRLALRADRASELVRVPLSSVTSLRESVPHAEFAAGTALLPDGLLVICDVALFLDETERASLEAALRERALERESESP